MKGELGGKFMKEFIGLRAKTYSYLINVVVKMKKPRKQKKNFIKIKIKFEDYKHSLEATQAGNNSLVENFRENNKQLIQNNNLMLKT